MPSHLRSSTSSPSSWRAQSPTSPQAFSPRRRMTPYLLRSHEQRFYQVGPITDTDNMPSTGDLQSPYAISKHLQMETHPLSSSASSSSANCGPVYGTDSGSTSRSSEVFSLHQPWQVSSSSSSSPLVDNPNNKQVQETSKPQHLKKSPFGKMTRGGSRSEAGKGGVSYIHQPSSPIMESPSSVSVRIDPNTQAQQQHIFDKWANSFGCDRNKTPTIIPSSLPQQSPSMNTRHSLTPTVVTPARSTSSSQLELFTDSRASSRLVNYVDEQPMNLSRPGSTQSTATGNNPIIANNEVPLDLRSQPPSRTATPASPLPSFTPPASFSRSPFDQSQRGVPGFGALSTGKLGIKSTQFMSKLPPSPLATNSRISSTTGHSFGVINDTSRKSGKVEETTTTELLQETTEKLHSMKLRSGRSLHWQQQHSKVSASRLSNGYWDSTIPLTRLGQSSGSLHSTTSAFPPSVLGSTENNRLTLHYTPPITQQQQQQQSSHPKRDFPLEKQAQTLPCPPPITTFRGLGTKVVDNSFSDILTNKLEDNYLKYRNLVLNKDGWLMTPFKFLHLLCNRMGVHIHKEAFNFYVSPRNIQYRTELYVGGFCGVGHAISAGFSEQLAAAHVLERMRIHFREIKQESYALFPGTRYTKVLEKLTSLCKTFDLGKVRMEYTDRHQQSDNRRGGGYNKRGWNYQDLELVRWECTCFVKSYRAVVMSDHMTYGGLLAARSMYMNFAKPPEVAVVQIKDYFGIGADCPMTKDIHASLLLNQPSINKLKWAKENQVPLTQLDAVLHDPMNDSRYLMSQFALPEEGSQCGNKMAGFQSSLKEALEWVQITYRRNNFQGMRMEQRQRGASNTSAAAGTTTTATNVMEAEAGDFADKDILDENDAEVEDIFHDASMDVEIEVV